MMDLFSQGRKAISQDDTFQSADFLKKPVYISESIQ